MKAQRGVTLIEILVVMAILCILAGVIVFAVYGEGSGYGSYEQACMNRGGQWYSSPRGDYYGMCREHGE